MQRSVKSRPEIIKRYYIHATGHLPLIHRLLERKDKDLDSEGRGGTWVNFCWVCAAGLSEPLPHYGLFGGQL